MEDTILLSILVLGITAFVCALLLYFISRKFAVPEEEKVFLIEEILPQANCGGCGKAGCHDFAITCAHADEKSFSKLHCPVGGNETMKKIATIMGFKATIKKPTVSVLRCNGTCENAPAKVQYEGIYSCRIANKVSCGQTGCPTGCLRLGDCVKVCQFGALSIDKNTGIPVIDENKCTSCGACVRTCPRQLFEIRSKSPKGNMVYVACRNTQKGAIARKNCKAACIACLKCNKINPEIKVENNLSYIPNDVSADDYGQELAQSCPTGAIIFTHCGDKKHD